MARQRLSDLSIVLYFLREGLGWSQTDLARAARTSPNLINDYEAGRKRLTRERLEHLLSFMDLQPGRIDAALAELEASRASARAASGPPDRFEARRRRIEAIASRFGRLATSFARAALNLLTAGSEAVHAREEAEHLWRWLKRQKPENRVAVIEEDRRFQKWGLAVLVTEESLAAAPNRPQESLELARLAVHIAERVGGSKEWRWRIQGYCGGILCNSLRACNDLPAARDARVRARKLWEDGAPGDPGLLNEAMLPWIEAACHRDQREFPQARKKIEEALELDNGELKGKILLTKSYIHDALDEPELSTSAALEALPLIDAEREPRLALVVRHNLLGYLTQLGRAEEARQRLPEVRRLAEQLGGELDLQRVGWLEGKIAYGLGDLAEARKRFEQVRRAFDKPDLSYDYALVSMELSLVLLKQGETVRVRAIAEEMFSIFRRQEVPVEALKALRIFCEAARQETATVELARRIVRYLYRAQSDPELRFEEAGAE
jgi:transcriptional regulator with XRE-family HTH domain